MKKLFVEIESPNTPLKKISLLCFVICKQEIFLKVFAKKKKKGEEEGEMRPKLQNRQFYKTTNGTSFGRCRI